jgi:anhydro-N-acetylmuramic acid kinase
VAKERSFIGLYSGAAAEGVDAAWAAISYRGLRLKVRQVHYAHRPYPPELVRRIRKLRGGGREDAPDIAELDRDIAMAFAEAAAALLRQSKASHEPFVAAGSSGQHVALVPPDKTRPIGSVVELGSPALIAQKTRLPVISQFVQSDIAAGGVGGPMSAFGDWVLLRDRKLSRVVVHVGGVVSLTFLGTDSPAPDVVAMDVGPGTAVLDLLAERDFGVPFDADGAIASRGSPNSMLLNELLSNPYFRRKWPKVSSPTEWGDAYVWRLMTMARKRRCERQDLLATVCELIARVVAQAVATMTERPHQVVLSGAGSRNIHLAGRIRAMLTPSSTITTEKLGVAASAKQALTYAVLAAARMDEFPLPCPNASGAKSPVVAGALTLP